MNSTLEENRTSSFLIEQFLSNKKLQSPCNQILIAMYATLIVVGATGNIAVVIAVIRKPIMRTARNLFILNLAISGKC